MHILEITIQRQNGNVWPVIIEHSYPKNDLPIRREGQLQLDEGRLMTKVRPQDYGQILGEALFHGAVGATWTNAVHVASGDYLRVLFHVEDSRLRTLRWERLSAPFTGDGWKMLLLNQSTIFAHYMPSLTDRRFPPFGRQDLRALVLVASPNGLEEYGLHHFDAIATAKHVKKALGDIPCDLLVNNMPEAVGPATPNALARQLMEQRYTLVHFVAHGQYSRLKRSTALFLADDQNQVQRVDGDQMLDQLKHLQPEHGFPHFAFLGTCDSAAAEAENVMGGMAQRLVRELGIPTVLAMTEQISIDTLKVLTTAFYARLWKHGEADRALVEAATTIETRFHDTVVPALYTRLEGRPLFSDDLQRPLTVKEVEYGLVQMEALLVERGPILLERFQKIAEELRLVPNAAHYLYEVGQLCQETLDISFPALAMGKEPPDYDARSPFKGLSNFSIEDKNFFFGRDELVEELTAKLKNHPFLAIPGSSGSGKSSLILAGVIPALQEEQGDDLLDILYMTPDSTPLETLKNLLSLMPRPDVIFIDQFEEIFTLCTNQEEQVEFAEYLHSLYLGPKLKSTGLESLEDTDPSIDDIDSNKNIADRILPRLMSSVPGLKGATSLFGEPEMEPILPLDYQPLIVLALREDFWDDCETLSVLYSVMEDHHRWVQPMDAADLRRAMEQQASAVGLRFEADLSHMILDDVASEPGAMPLLQHGLQELWENRHGRWLRTSEYRKIGGIRQTIARKAERIYSSLSKPEKTLMRHVMLRLIRLDSKSTGDAKPRDTRQHALQTDLTPARYDEADMVAMVTGLANHSLVVTKHKLVTGEDTVEIAHEALISYWDRLQRWIQLNRDCLLKRQAISDATHNWQSNGRDGSFFYRGRLLREAYQLANENPDMLNDSEYAFLHRSKQRQWVGWLVPTGIIIMLILGIFIWNQDPPTVEFTQESEEPVISFAWDDANRIYAGLENEGRIIYGMAGQKEWPSEEIGGDSITELVKDPNNSEGFYTALGGDYPVYVTKNSVGLHVEKLSAPIQDAEIMAISSDGSPYIANGDRPYIYTCKSKVECKAGKWHSIQDNDIIQDSDRVDGINFIEWTDQNQDERLLAGVGNWLWQWQQASNSWVSHHIGAFVSDAVAYDSRLFVGHDLGITFIEDGDEQCTFLDAVLITDMTLIDEDNAPIVVAGTVKGQLFSWRADSEELCDSDSPATELPMEHGTFIYTVGFEPEPPHRLWVATRAGLFSGETKEWRKYNAR